MTIAQALEDFLAGRRLEGRQEATLKIYRQQVLLFARWVGEDWPVEKLSRDQVISLFENLPGRTSNGKAYLWRHLRAFFNYLMREGLWRAKRGEKKLTEGISFSVEDPQIPALLLEEVAAMLRAANRSRWPHRDKALIYMFVDTGLRRREMVDVRVDDLDLEAGICWVRRGKTGKPRPVALGYKSSQYLKRYLRTDREKLLKGRTSEYLWVRREGRRMTEQALRERIYDLGKAAGLSKNAGPRVLRHTMTRLLLLEGVDWESLRKQGGWANYNQIMRYASLLPEDQKRMIDRNGPSSKL